MYLGENIRYLRKKTNMSQEELADKLGYKSYTTIQKWESGVSEPPLRSLKKMADMFNIDMDQMTEIRLMTDAEKFWEFAQEFNKRRSIEVAKPIRIPILGRVAAGSPINAEEEIIGWEELPAHAKNADNYFGLLIKGNSMEPGIQNGDTVIVKQQPDADDGQIVIAIVNGNDGCCKRLKKYSDGTIALMSDNPQYPPMYFSLTEIDDIPVRICGIVTELRRRF